MGVDDNASTLVTQETSVKNLVYIMNIQEENESITRNTRNDGKNPSKQDDKKPSARTSPLEKSLPVNHNDNLKDYGKSGIDNDMGREKEWKKKAKKMKKVIHMDFDTDDDVEEQLKNANDAKAEGKVQVKKKMVHYYEFSSEDEGGKQADPKRVKKTKDDHAKSQKNDENDKALVAKEMTLSNIGKDIFIGDSAATSHMTNNKTGVYDLTPIGGSVMIGNGESISCTHKGKLDVICKHRDGSMARETWDMKIVPQLNHDLFSFTKAMKEGWQMNGRWKEGGLMIELFKTTRASMKFDRMIPSGSSWLMGIKTQRLVGQAHVVIEPGKSIPIWKFHQMTGHTGEHLLKTTAENMGIKLTRKLGPCEVCAQAKIRQANVPKKKEKQVPSRPGYRMFIDISSFKHKSMGGKRHWLIAVDEFSDYSHSFFLWKKSDQTAVIPIWIKGLKTKYGIVVKNIRLDNSGENRSLQKEFVERKIPTLMGRARAMMIQAGFSQQDRRKFWCEVISTATKLDNIMVRRERTKPPHTLFYNEDARYKKYLRSFGKMAVIAISDGKKMRSQLDTRGRTGIFVGYADDHAGNVYRFINIQTKKIILSRDVQWLNSFWKQYKQRNDDLKKFIEEFFPNDEDDQTSEESEPEENNVSDNGNNVSGDGNNTMEQKKLGIDIDMIGARKEELGRTRSQTKEMMSPKNESMERAELTMEDWIQVDLPNLSSDIRTN